MSNPFVDLPALDSKTHTLNAIIDTPKGRFGKAREDKLIQQSIAKAKAK